MGEKLLLERGFIFEADDEKGFRKLRDNQFPRVEQGVVLEPIANALDQQQGDDPIEVTLVQLKNGDWRLSYRDNGCGLLARNLQALHFIGESTKRDQLMESIGRFGMGLTSAFHRKLAVERVEIETHVCGQPGRISYDSRDDAIPQWCWQELDSVAAGLTISFFLPKSSHKSVQRALDVLLDKTVVPIICNGKRYCCHPDLRAHKANEIFVKECGDHEIYYSAYPEEPEDVWNKRDEIAIYVCGLPVEEGEMYRVFVTTGGDKMPQNYGGRPFMKDESCVVLSATAEPTVGRDKLVRDKAFDAIGMGVERARAQALLQLLDNSLKPGCKKGIIKYAGDMALANIYTLSGVIVEHLKGNPAQGDKAFLAPLAEALLGYPLFPVFEFPDRLSLREIVKADIPHKVMFFASNADEVEPLAGCHGSPFVLKECRYVFSAIWGGHEQQRIAGVLKRITDGIGGYELLDMEQLATNPEKLEELEKRGVLKLKPTRLKMVEYGPEELDGFLDRLRSILNRPWFREALVRFRPPQRIHLRLVQVEQRGVSGDLVAAILPQSTAHDLGIGLNVDSPLIRGLASNPHGHFAFLPILCHELAHRRRTSLSDVDELHHGTDFYLERIRLEDTVLAACARFLLGEEISGGEDREGAEPVLVL